MILNLGENLTFTFLFDIYKNNNKQLNSKVMKTNLKPIKDYEGYFINEIGEVYSNKWKKTLRQLKPQRATQSKKKYLQVRLFNFEGGKLYYVHRLMWETFKGPIPEDKSIDHIDGDTANNNLSNLQLLTRRQNTKKYHRSKTDLWRLHREQMVKDYEELGSYGKVAKKWGCSSSTAWYVVLNKVLAVKNGKYYYADYKQK